MPAAKRSITRVVQPEQAQSTSSSQTLIFHMIAMACRDSSLRSAAEAKRAFLLKRTRRAGPVGGDDPVGDP